MRGGTSSIGAKQQVILLLSAELAVSPSKADLARAYQDAREPRLTELARGRLPQSDSAAAKGGAAEKADAQA